MNTVVHAKGRQWARATICAHIQCYTLGWASNVWQIDIIFVLVLYSIFLQQIHQFLPLLKDSQKCCLFCLAQNKKWQGPFPGRRNIWVPALHSVALAGEWCAYYNRNIEFVYITNLFTTKNNSSQFTWECKQSQTLVLFFFLFFAFLHFVFF